MGYDRLLATKILYAHKVSVSIPIPIKKKQFLSETVKHFIWGYFWLYKIIL